ncbi:MAG: plasmid pRiA4b ORF-3 family protein, partial [Verrucomicrobiota bacterium]|nr:plasmid pRiA4b ORF-3 family protein [Verrucomicrobiota bacterium]
MAKRKSKPESLYQLKVTLCGSKPPIWRRLIVADNIGLGILNNVLQISMGWDGYHLHQYIVGGNYIGVPQPEFDFGLDMIDEETVLLKDLLSKPKDNLIYEYDFGDSWKHKIVLEKILLLDSSKSPIVIKGKMACPPEDCGGLWGYEDLLKTLKDPKHEEYYDMLDWLGGDFDPKELNL